MEEKKEKDNIKIDNKIKEEINEKKDEKEIKQNDINTVDKILNNHIMNEKEVKQYYFNNNKIETKIIQIEYLSL